MKILIDKFTKKVISVGSDDSFNIVINVSDDFTLTKTIEEEKGLKQKTNELGQALYLKEIYKTVPTEKVVGKDETLEDTGDPIMTSVQKIDDRGDKLYLEPIRELDGTIIDFVETTEPKDETGEDNEPAIIEVQKTSITGKPLFWKEIKEIVDEKVLESTEEVIEDTGKPILIPNIQYKNYDIKLNPEKFTIEDVLSEKYQVILENSQKTHIVADIFLNESDLDLEDPNHLANTGYSILELLPNGQAKTKTINLEAPSAEFELLEFSALEGVDIYLSGKKFVNNKLTLSSPVSNCTIKFVNTTNKSKIIKSYAIGY